MNKLLVILISLASFQATAQNNKENARQLLVKAVKMMDDGDLDKSIETLKEAEHIDSTTYLYAYEIAYAYQMKEDYKQAIKNVERALAYKDGKDDLYQLAGNIYDMSGDSAKALEVYRTGLTKFPNSGRLYLEQGNVYYNRKMYNEAIPYYEKGIKADPMYPSNYFRTALLFLASTEEVWGLMYGEIFILLEPNSERTRTISQRMLEVYQSEIKWDNDTSLSVSFSQQASINAKDLKKDKFKLPFGVGVYEPCISIAAAVSSSTVDYETVCKIREKTLDCFYERGFDKEYDNIVFSFQKKVKDAGHLEAYNHWLLLAGDEAGFSKWEAKNKKKFDAFADWIGSNLPQINSKNLFLRSKFE